ncbi:hypothetical protein QEW_1236 [Clostridioides difficile CD160]|nr:hypothetical protein QEW_1236 [Clostridioides difficile CD160]
MDRLIPCCGVHPKCYQDATVWLIPREIKKPTNRCRKGDLYE